MSRYKHIVSAVCVSVLVILAAADVAVSKAENGTSSSAGKENAPDRPTCKIFIETDLEGASGVYEFAQVGRGADKGNAKHLLASEYLMGDLDAVVRGLRDGGATEIIVSDGHGPGAFLPHLLPPGAKYITGDSAARSTPVLDESFSAVVMLAFHAMMGTPKGVLNHTQSSRSENRYWYNGVESGEIAQTAIVAGHFGIPAILVTGDTATCEEAKKFLGENCVTVAVKRGLSREGAVLYPFAETRQALYEGAKRAVAAIPQCKPYQPTLPIQVKKQWLEFDGPDKKPHLMTKEGTAADALHLMDF
jgi:D-amino peptidase